MESGKRGMNYWPGFVDALSNMVMVMIFVVLVFTVALVFFSMEVAKKNRLNGDQAKEGQCQTLPLESTQDSTRVGQLPAALTAESRLKKENDALKTALLTANAKNTDLSAKLDAQVVKPSKSQPSAALVSGRSAVQSVLPGATEVALASGVAASETSETSKGRLPPSVSGENGVITIEFKGSEVSLPTASVEPLDRALGSVLPQAASLHCEITAEVAVDSNYTANKRQAYFRALTLRNYLIRKGFRPENVSTHVIDAIGSGSGRVFVRPYQ
jgi:hypothetical protein